MTTLPRLLDLTDDGRVGLLDAVGWVVVLSALGLAVLVVGGAVFTALLWSVKGVVVVVALTWRGALAALAGAVRGIRGALDTDAQWARPGQARSHQAPSSPP